MATPQQVENLQNAVAALDEIEMEKLKRTTLGEESLAAALEPRLTRINRLKTLATQYAIGVHSNTVSQLTKNFQELKQAMSQQADRPNPDFIAQRQAFLTSIDSLMETAKQWEPAFIASAIEARGFLEDEGIRQEYERTVNDLNTQSKKTLEEVKAEADRTIGEAKKLAEEIETRARRTAAKVSVEEAQSQFKAAQKSLDTSTKIWAGLSAVAIVLFFLVAWQLSSLVLPSPESAPWQNTYNTIFRIVILSAVGAIAGFCLKILRAYMNMRERNLHRQRVANSIEAFVVSAQTPEVRDVILAQLADAVVSFGVSGLLTKETDSVGTQRISTEAMTRLIGSLSAKKDSM